MSLHIKFNMIKGKETNQTRVNVKQYAENLMEIIQESIQTSLVSPDMNTKKAKLDLAMNKIIELIKLTNKYPVVDSKRLSSIYNSIRDARSEYKALDSNSLSIKRRDVA